jgi:hypothetical protein
MDIDSDNRERFHMATGSAVAKARITQMANTRRQPGGTSRPTVHPRTPQATAAIAP